MRKALASLLMLAFLSGCGGLAAPTDQLPAPGTTQKEPPAAEVDRAVTAASVRFGLDLLKEVYKAKPGENHFLSPVSAGLILTLTANGAAGETRQAMLEALRYEGIGLETINQASGALQTILANPDPRVELTVANALWYRKDLTLAPAFAAVAKEEYQAEVRTADFGHPSAAKAINDWVAEATRGKIPRLVDGTDADNLMWLVNALYFKGAWTHPFEKEGTRPGDFYRLDGTTKQVPFMRQTGELGYLEAAGEGNQGTVRGVRLSYGGGRFSLYAIMPERWEGFVEGLTADRFEGWVAAMQPTLLTLHMPKVKLEYAAELVEPLNAMGMGAAFDPETADFSGLFTEGPRAFISRVIQKTILDLNEEGTEAAAATGVMVDTAGAPVSPPSGLEFDRPFLLAIRDDQTGALLFVGVILEP